MTRATSAVLALADGTCLWGKSYGYPAEAKGELVFNTSMTGYQEILTDPSYAGQIITFTYPHIGNTGINLQDIESQKIHGAAMVLREPSLLVSNYRAEDSLANYLYQQKCPAIAYVDTRRLTRLLRDKGCQNACIMSCPPKEDRDKIAKQAVAKASKLPPISNHDWAAQVSINKAKKWQHRAWRQAQESIAQSPISHAYIKEEKEDKKGPHPVPKSTILIGASGVEGKGEKGKKGDKEDKGGKTDPHPVPKSTILIGASGVEEKGGKGEKEDKEDKTAPHIVVYDCGVKQNILRLLKEQSCQVTYVPLGSKPAAVLKNYKPDGILISNGPGDPDVCQNMIANIRYFLARKIPLFGICLGHQLLGLAYGLRVFKMKHGHHGANHPVKDLTSGQVLITSQNHNFALSEESLNDNIRITHRSLFDNTIQGIELLDRPAFSFQGHPEASPGPHDLSYLFKKFVSMIKNA